MKLRTGDTVLVISGKDRGKKSKIIKVLPGEGKVVVEGVNIIKKHKRPRKQGEKGQKIEVPSPIDASNMMLICPKCGKPARAGYKVVENKKYRICKKCGQEI